MQVKAFERYIPLTADKFVLKFVFNKSIGKGSMHYRKNTLCRRTWQ